MEWKVGNALSRDVERQHLNKILADIRSTISGLGSTSGSSTTTTNTVNTVTRYAVARFTITLQGDVTGTAEVDGLNDVVIETTLDNVDGFVEEAPIDSRSYWRRNGEWRAVPMNLEQRPDGTGILVQTVDDEDVPYNIVREIDVVTGELTITDGDGQAGNPTLGLADDGVTYAKMQNISAASKLIGRGSASGAGDPQEITIGSGLAMTGTTLSATASFSDGDYGDITVSGSGAVWTVDNDVITYAKMQNVSAASKLLGRGSAAGSGDVQEISIGSGLSMSGTTLSATAAGIADADYGDITVTSSGTVWTIDNNVVTYAKMQDVSTTSRVIGRKTSGSGDPEEVTLSELLDFIGSAAQGDILYRGASSWARLGAGTAGHVLTTGGAGANPSWAAAGATSSPTVTWSPTDKNANITLSSGDLVATKSAAGDGHTPWHATAYIPIGRAVYWEVKALTMGEISNMAGLSDIDDTLSSGTYPGATTRGVSLYSANGQLYMGGAVQATYSSWTAGDVIGFAYYESLGWLWIAKNNSWFNSGDPANLRNRVLTVARGLIPSGSIYRGGSITTLKGCFKASDQTYSPPSGFSPIDTN